ncbi:hypothetical protein O0L34_g14189 [Tuta absoluta]|nr:hypothetical protein O0L34_g14189 [Tuta absoluta]
MEKKAHSVASEGREMARISAVSTAVLLIVATGLAKEDYQLSDAEYYALPRLFRMDDYDACVATDGTYCLGSFLLRPRTPDAHQLYDVMLKYSQGAHNFNHTVFHRGYCITSRCSHIQASSNSKLFEKCVSERTNHQYGLEAKLLKLDFCESKRTHDKPYDEVEMIFAWIVGGIVLLNLVGTTYDLLRNQDAKPNKYLIAWSIRVNWCRLFATYDTGGDPRLTALKSVQGIRAFTLAMVMLAHSMIVHHMAYIHNPEIIERNGSHWASMIFHNGSVVVQAFFLLSSFLFTYNLLILAETKKKKLNLCMLPQCLMHRVIRILPLHLFMVGLTATWWVRSSSGALWTPLIRESAAACRRKWWTHALFLNNLIYPDDKCLIQSWFLAADMQLYIVAAALTLLLARSRKPVRILSILLLGSVLANFAIAYYFNLKPIMMLMNPEQIRSQYVGEPSFNWLYSAPWGSLPASLLGVLLAFLQRDLLASGYKPESSLIFRIAYPLFFPALILWLLGGHLVRGASPIAVAAYAAVDRVGYVLIGTVGLIGFFNHVDSIWKRFFEWRGWVPIGRMSLAVLLVHWNYNLTHIALRTQPSRVAVYEIGGHWHSVEFMTYASAIPLHLCLELPAQRFLQAFLF